MESLTKMIYGFLYQVCTGASKLPFAELTGEERQKLGGLLFREAPYLVGLVGAALSAHPVLFAHFAVKGPALLARQGRALAFKALWRCLWRMQQRAWDSYLLMQAGAVAESNLTLHQIEAEDALPMAQLPGHEERKRALLAALLFVSDRQERLRNRIRGARQRGLLAGSRPARRPLQAQDLALKLLQTRWSRPAAKAPSH